MNLNAHIEKGKQVRCFFEEDLKKIPPGFCFLPEWICNSMTNIALQSHHTILFYPVNFPEQSEIPLETDWAYLIRLIKKYAIYKKNIIILAAFPLGYIDYKIQMLFYFHKQIEKMHLFLDLAQSYGAFNFSEILSKIEAIYISFNGRKLIDCGGALRFSNSPSLSENLELQIFHNSVQKALQKQKESWLKTCEIIQATYCSRRDFKRILRKYNHSSKRSSYHRTGLAINSDASLTQDLVKQGFGQFIHPNPQQNVITMSHAYEEWKNNIFLLFPTRREAEGN